MNLKSVTVSPESPFSDDAAALMDELSERLEAIAGASGKNSFNIDDVCNSRAIFVIARNQDGQAVGCGAFRPLSETTAEVKRMYAKEPGLGIGGRILSYLENQASHMGYKTLRLETRVVNGAAVSFYQRNGYQQISNYGKYEGRIDSICFEKELSF